MAGIDPKQSSTTCGNFEADFAMKYVSLLRLARISALPIPDSSREKLRQKERRIGYYGALLWIVILVAIFALDLPRVLSASVLVCLILSAYVVLAVEGRAMVLMLLLVAAATILAAYLSNSVSYRSVVGLILLMIPAFMLSVCWIGRLQFIRSCGPEWRNWPSQS